MEWTLDNVKKSMPLACAIIIGVIVLIWLYNRVSRPREVYLIYADWCPACTNFQPTWEMLKQQHPGQLKEINSDNKEQLYAFKTKHGIEIEGFPTIVAVGPKGVEKFSGKRTPESLKQFIRG